MSVGQFLSFMSLEELYMLLDIGVFDIHHAVECFLSMGPPQ